MTEEDGFSDYEICPECGRADISNIMTFPERKSDTIIATCNDCGYNIKHGDWHGASIFDKPKTLSNEEKINFFDMARKFEILNDKTDNSEIYIEYRGKSGHKFADVWAITSYGHCYVLSKKKWIDEPMPSNRSDKFLAISRYTLKEAFDIALKLAEKHYEVDNK
jgi:predicted RNA-binding Zn-ribbon protein involved in translation (DUF1610 family)